MRVKIWYYFCLLFFIYNLIILNEDKYSVNYRLILHVENKIDYRFNISICLSINDLLNDKQISKYKGKNELMTKLNVSEFLDFVYDEIMSSKFEDDNPLLNRNSYFYNNYTCYLINQTLISSLNLIKNFKYVILSHQINHPFFSNYIFHKKTKSNKLAMLKIHKFRGISLPYPYSNCENNDGNINKFDCLHDCLKKISKLSLYLYRYKDNDLINISNNQIDYNQAKLCFDKCENVYSCILDYYMSISYSSTNNEPFTFEIVNSIYQAFTITNFEYFLQAAGLITLFFSLSFASTIPGLIKLISKAIKIDNTFYFKKYYPKIKLILILIILLTVIALSIYVFIDYYNGDIIKSKFYHTLRKIEPFSIVLCLPIQYLILSKKFKFTLEDDQMLIKNYTFKEMEKLTRIKDIKLLIRKSFIKYGSEEIDYKWNLNNKILFRTVEYKLISDCTDDENSNFKNDQCTNKLKNTNGKNQSKKRPHSHDLNYMKLFSRCFEMNFIDYQEPRYQQLLSISILNFQLRNYFTSVFVLFGNQKFNLNSYQYNGDYKILKKVITSANCVNYSIYNLKIGNYREEFIEFCYLEEYLINYKSIPINTIINGNEINETFYFNQTIDKRINFECKLKYKLDDCELIVLSDSLKPYINYLTRSNININNLINYEIDLYLLVTEQRETSQSFSKMILNIFNIESIFFNMNLLKLLNLFLIIINRSFRIKYLIFYKYLIKAICLICLLIHFNVIFRSIINEEIRGSGYYFKNLTIKCPDEMFCINIDHNLIDPNIKLTANYLYNITSNVNFETVFDKLIFRKNGSNYALDFRTFKDENEDFKILTMFYRSMKCLILRNFIRYDISDFFFINKPEDSYPVKLYLNKSFRTDGLYFLSKKPTSLEFTEMNLLKIDKSENMNNENKLKYQIRHEILEIIIEDKFRYVKHPLSLFYKENYLLQSTSYLNKMKDDFHKYKLASLLMVTLKEDGEFEIDDDLFHQHYLQDQNVTDNLYPNSPNSKLQVYSNYIQLAKIDQEDKDQPDFDFFCRTKITNQDNYAKLIQQILNSLSTWLNICLLDLHNYLFKLFYIFTFIYNCLINCKNLLIKFID